MEKIDYATMTGPGLVHAYNEMVAEAATNGLDGYRPVAKFSDTKTGAKRCEALASSLRARAAGLNGKDDAPAKVAAAEAKSPEAKTQEPAATELPKTLIDAHVAEIERAGAEVVKLGTAADADAITSKTSLGEMMTSLGEGGAYVHDWETPPAKAKKVKKVAEASSRQGRKILAQVDKFPGREASIGERHFREMVGKTVAEYVSACPKGKYGGTAPDQWLSYFLREGWVKLDA